MELLVVMKRFIIKKYFKNKKYENIFKNFYSYYSYLLNN